MSRPLNDVDWEVQEAIRLGLGDRFEQLFRLFGIPAVMDAVKRATGKDCGCARRKAKLNEIGQRLGIGVPKPPAP